MTGDGEFHHVPVMPAEVVAQLALPEDRPARLIDCTVGGGGHSAALLEHSPKLEVLGIDRDPDALDAAVRRLAFAKHRVTLAHGSFSDFPRIAAGIGWDRVDAILFDLGVSSPQIDRPERGFSWRTSAALDMRMDPSQPLTAARLLNQSGEEELERIFRDYGEIVGARQLARAVVARRAEHPFGTTAELVALCDEVLRKPRPGAPPPPTLVFQALRIAVNDELGEIERALEAVPAHLVDGGRVAVISFHSLEDRIVKNFFRRESAGCLCPPGLPVCRCGHRPSLRIVIRKPLVAGAAEVRENRRAACAKLRVAERLPVETKQSIHQVKPFDIRRNAP